MAYGLQIWDAAGKLLLDIEDRISRIHGIYSVTIPAYPTEATIYIPGMVNDGTWAVAFDIAGDNREIGYRIDTGYIALFNQQTYVSSPYTISITLLKY